MHSLLLSIVVMLGSLTPILCEVVSDQLDYIPTHSGDCTDNDVTAFMKKYEKKIFYRLVSNKTWTIKKGHPDGDDVLDEYPGDEGTATEAMVTEWYPSIKKNLKAVRQLFTEGEEYDKKLQSIIIYHPLNGRAHAPFVRKAMTALRLRNLHKRYNFFAVEMPGMNPVLIREIFKVLFRLNGKIEELAILLSKLITKGIEDEQWKAKDIHIVGMSITGNLMGYIGRHIQKKHQQKLGSILSLDPHHNDKNPHFIPVNAGDAHIVHVYHSNSHHSGSTARVATADFVFNGGRFQPECLHRIRFTNPYDCSHINIAFRFWYIILFPSKFRARRCDYFKEFKKCNYGDEVATITYPIEQNTANGIYQIRTTGEKPYGMGQEGANCDPNEKQPSRIQKITSRSL